MKKTLENLVKAFIGESQARNRYTMYAQIAKDEGYEEIAANFSLTADQEAEHAKWLMTMINGLKEGNSEYDEIVVESSAPTILGNTKENLKSAMEGERYENSKMYPEFADVADSEGLSHIALRLRSIVKAEENHEEKYKNFLESLEKETVFKSDDEEQTWVCRKCGYIHKGKSPVGRCPACGSPQGFFERKK